MNLDGGLSVVALNFANNICRMRIWILTIQTMYVTLEEISELHHTM